MIPVPERDVWTDRLSEYIDGELEPGDRAALEVHLAVCPTCARTLSDLREVVTSAAAIAPRAPERDLWPGIEARIAATPVPASPASAAPATPGPAREPVRLEPRRARRFAFTMPQLAAAGFLLALLSGSLVWMALTRGPLARPAATGSAPLASGAVQAPAAGGANPTAVPATVAATAPTTDSGTAATIASFDRSHYEAAIEQLQKALDQHHGDLDPATIRVIRENLQAIDAAIDQAQRALAADPANGYLNDHLVQQMRRKVDLLRQVTVLAGTEE